MVKVLPLLLALLGLAIGSGAGFALRPAQKAQPADVPKNHVAERPEDAPDVMHGAPPTSGSDAEFVKLNNQFVIPVVKKGRVSALVVLSLSLEVAPGTRARIYQIEPKLRDALLQVMFDHANAGGFSGTFTDSTAMTTLRLALLEASRKILGNTVRNVLIADIVRQDT